MTATATIAWRRGLRIVCSAIIWAMFALVLLLVLAVLVVPRVTGAVPLTVLSGSMSPTLSQGSIVVVEPVDPDSLVIGDVITFQARSGESALITHRIVGVDVGGEQTTFRTKGDANDAIDPSPVRAAQIRGKVWYEVPRVGFALDELNGSRRENGVRIVGVGLALWSAYLICGGLRARRSARRSEQPAAS